MYVQLSTDVLMKKDTVDRLYLYNSLSCRVFSSQYERKQRSLKCSFSKLL